MRGNEDMMQDSGWIYYGEFTIPMRGNERKRPRYAPPWPTTGVYDPHEG